MKRLLSLAVCFAVLFLIQIGNAKAGTTGVYTKPQPSAESIRKTTAVVKKVAENKLASEAEMARMKEFSDRYKVASLMICADGTQFKPSWLETCAPSLEQEPGLPFLYLDNDINRNGIPDAKVLEYHGWSFIQYNYDGNVVPTETMITSGYQLDSVALNQGPMSVPLAKLFRLIYLNGYTELEIGSPVSFYGEFTATGQCVKHYKNNILTELKGDCRVMCDPELINN